MARPTGELRSPALQWLRSAVTVTPSFGGEDQLVRVLPCWAWDAACQGMGLHDDMANCLRLEPNIMGQNSFLRFFQFGTSDSELCIGWHRTGSDALQRVTRVSFLFSFVVQETLGCTNVTSFPHDDAVMEIAPVFRWKNDNGPWKRHVEQTLSKPTSKLSTC